MRSPTRTRQGHTLALTLAAVSALGLQAANAAAPGAGTCSASSGAIPPTVVELYTSEGCSSCPPADRWLSALKAGPQLLALAFHVNYWDRLGWPDRFASPAATERQRQLPPNREAGQVYTPQVLVDGGDWRRWPALPAARERGTVPTLRLGRDGGAAVAEIGALGPNAGAGYLAGYLSGYWAVLEDGHETKVRAGENRGETLRHDHVVRAYLPVPAWPASQPQRLVWTPPPGEPGHGQRLVFIVTDAATQKPLQALALGC